MNSPHKGPVTREMFPSDDVIMIYKKKCCIWGGNTRGKINYSHPFLSDDVNCDLGTTSDLQIRWCTCRSLWRGHNYHRQRKKGKNLITFLHTTFTMYCTLMTTVACKSQRRKSRSCDCLFLIRCIALCVTTSLKRKCRHFEEIFVNGCPESCHFETEN